MNSTNTPTPQLSPKAAAALELLKRAQMETQRLQREGWTQRDFARALARELERPVAPRDARA